MIKLQDYNFLYSRGNGIKDINLKFQKGRAYALIGPNGAGKTTLFNVIKGRLKGTGIISVCGRRKSDEFLLKASHSSLFEGKEIIAEYKKVLDYIKQTIAVNGDMDKDYIGKYIEEFDIDIYSSVKQLSKGNQLIFKLILSLSRDVDFYVLDEPFAGIDQINKERVLEIILKKVTEGKTVILSSQDIDNIGTYFDEYIFLKEGSVIKKTKQKNMDSLKDTYYEFYKGGKKDDK